MEALSLAERITASFYAWELRGRGWELASYPVELEPPFRRCFLLPNTEEPRVPIDDGRRPTVLSSLAEGIRGLFVSPARVSQAPEPGFEEQEPFPAEEPDSLVSLAVRVGQGCSSDPAVAAPLPPARC